MCKTTKTKRFLTATLALTILSLFLGSAFASVTIPQRPIYFPFNNGAYLTFDLSILPLTFSGNPQSVYRDTVNKWHFGTVWITSTTDVTVTAWFLGDWLNYTVPSSGTQQISNGSKPQVVVLDGVNKTEGDGWSYLSGTITITSAVSSAALFWYLVPNTNTVGYQLGVSVVAAAGFMGIVMLLGMVYVATSGKDVKYAVMLAVGEVLLLVTMLILSQLAILG